MEGRKTYLLGEEPQGDWQTSSQELVEVVGGECYCEASGTSYDITVDSDKVILNGLLLHGTHTDSKHILWKEGSRTLSWTRPTSMPDPTLVERTATKKMKKAKQHAKRTARVMM